MAKIASVIRGEVVMLPDPSKPEPSKKPWVPKIGIDTRDLRDPEKVGKALLRRRKK